MNKRLLDLVISCRLEFSFRPTDDLATSSDVSGFLNELHENAAELVSLLEDKEVVSTCKYELTPQDNGLVEIRSWNSNRTPFYLSFNDLKSICETCSLFERSERSLEIGIGFSKPEVSVYDYKIPSEFNGHAYQSIENEECEVDEECDIDRALFSLNNYNNYNRLCDRTSCFQEVSLPQHEHANNAVHDNVGNDAGTEDTPESVVGLTDTSESVAVGEASHATSLEINTNEPEEREHVNTTPENDIHHQLMSSTPEPFNDPLIFQTLGLAPSSNHELENGIHCIAATSTSNTEHGESINVPCMARATPDIETNDPPSDTNSDYFNGRNPMAQVHDGPPLSLSDTPGIILGEDSVNSENSDTLGTLNKPSGSTVSSFLDTRELCDELPPKELNVVGILQEYLAKHDDVEAFLSLTYKYDEPVVDKTSLLLSFSTAVSFTIEGVKHRYENSTRFKNKPDSKRNVAYKACKALGLPKYNAAKRKSKNVAIKDWKNRLQELFQGDPTYSLPEYESKPVQTLDGPRFGCTVTVKLDNGESQCFTCDPTFRKTKDAEKNIAEIAYKALISSHEI